MTEPKKAPRQLKKPVLIGCLSFILVMLVILIAAGIYELSGSPVPAETANPIDMNTVRQFAGEENLPLRLNMIDIGSGQYPGAIIIAGAGFESMTMAMPAFQLIQADGSSVMIDAASTRADFEAMFQGGTFNDEKYDQLQTGLSKASLIIFTHEHADHLSGFLHSTGMETLLPQVRMSTEQLAGAEKTMGLSKDLQARISPISYDDYTAVAPGVVLIKMPGHSAGSQMVYVRLADGKEFLLVGDVVWNMQNITELRGRPHLSNQMLGEDPAEHTRQVRALADLMQNEPTLHLLISHDVAQLQAAVQAGWIQDHLE